MISQNQKQISKIFRIFFLNVKFVLCYTRHVKKKFLFNYKHFQFQQSHAIKCYISPLHNKNVYLILIKKKNLIAY